MEVLEEFNELRGIQIQRTRIPIDAEEPLKVRLFAGADAGADCMVAGIWLSLIHI